MSSPSKNVSRVVFWTGMMVALGGAFMIFKDLADISQWLIQSSRETTMAVWYNRIPITVVSLVAFIIASAVWVKTKVAVGKKAYAAIFLLFFASMFSGMINPYIMMRPRQEGAVFVDVERAWQYLRADESVIVYEIDGVARAHADVQVLRPHVAGGDPVNGQEIVMTYCGLTNLGIAFIPEIDGQKLDLAPLTQLENNLVLVDHNSGEPIQQLWGQMETDVVAGTDRGMAEYPTFRMPFEKFAVAYPDGEVFINDYLVKDMRPGFLENPFLYGYDRAMEFVFNSAIVSQREEEAPVFPTIDHYDDRLPNKALVWAFDVNGDYVAYTEEFVRDNNNVVNATIGGEDIVIAWDEQYQSLGVYYNLTGEEVIEINFFGETDTGIVFPRVETVKAGAYWVVWANFFPETDLNRV